MTTNIERAALVARQVQIRSVGLRSAQLTSDVDPLTPPEELRLDQKYRARYEMPEGKANQIHVYVDFQFTAFDSASEEGDAEVVRLESTYLLVYELEGSEDVPEDAFEHFATLNGTYNAWPYWRELVQTVTGRVGLSPIVVPVFRPTARTLEETSS
jgi:hypothetical protein